MKTKVLFLLLCSCCWLSAQTSVWTLQNCFDEAMRNSIELKIKLLEVKRAERSQSSIITTLLPTIGLYGSHTYNFGSTIDPATNGRVSSNIQYDNFYINANINLIDLNAFIANTQSKLDTQKAKAETEVFENEYKLQIAESYYQALYTQELLRIREEQLNLLTTNLLRVEKEVDAGSKPKSDLYDMQLSVAAETIRIAETSQLLDNQKTELLHLINATTVLAKSIILSETEVLSSGNSTGFKTPALTLAEINYQYALKTTSRQQAASLPSLAVFYQFSTFYYKPLNQPNVMVDNFSVQLGDNKNHQAGLQLVVPVFNGLKNRNRIAATKIEAEKAKSAIEAEKQKNEKQLALENQKREQYNALQPQLERVVQLAKLSYKTTQAKFENGKIDALLYTTAKSQWLQSEYDLLKNKLMIEFSEVKIKLLTQNRL